MYLFLCNFEVHIFLLSKHIISEEQFSVIFLLELCVSLGGGFFLLNDFLRNVGYLGLVCLFSVWIYLRWPTDQKYWGLFRLFFRGCVFVSGRKISFDQKCSTIKKDWGEKLSACDAWSHMIFGADLFCTIQHLQIIFSPSKTTQRIVFNGDNWKRSHRSFLFVFLHLIHLKKNPFIYPVYILFLSLLIVFIVGWIFLSLKGECSFFMFSSDCLIVCVQAMHSGWISFITKDLMPLNIAWRELTVAVWIWCCLLACLESFRGVPSGVVTVHPP